MDPALQFRRIHILGASGSGTSTLGQAIAQRWGHVHLDTDDFFWEPSDPPFQRSRPPTERIRLLSKAMQRAEHWVNTGSLCGWSDVFIPQFDLVVFLYVPTELRLERLEQREALRFGPRIEPGGDMHQIHQDFMQWAASYGHADQDTRSHQVHQHWLANLPCPVLQLAGDFSVQELRNRLEGFNPAISP